MRTDRQRVQIVADALANLSSRFRDEYELQDNVARALRAAGLAFDRERVFSTGRVDFAVTVDGATVVVEVKVDGDVAGVTRQIVRYLSHEEVVGVVLVSSRAVHSAALVSDINGKPVRVVRPTAGAL